MPLPSRLGVPFLSRRRADSSGGASANEIQHNSGSNFVTRRMPSAFSLRTPQQQQQQLSSAINTENSGLFIKSAQVPQRDPPPTQTTQRPWRKLLYIKQDYPDDYVDNTFLMELQKNANVRMYDYSTIMMQTTVVTQHISSIMIFIGVYINLYKGNLTGKQLAWTSSISTVLGVIFWDLLNMYLRTPEPRIVRLNLIKGAVLFALLLFGLSPVLRTLTKDTSKDTIWAMTVLFFGVNLAFHDYSTGNLTNIRFPGSVSLNAAVLASVLLASQLDDNLRVFAFLSFALKWFALFPIFRRYLKRVSPKASIAATVMLALGAFVMFLYILRFVAMLFVFSTLFITFGCPLWLIWVQRYKNEIHGPWDEARPIVHRYYR